MKALVTGGAGFIGSHLADALRLGGAEVHIIDNLSSGLREQVHPSARLHEEDITMENISDLIQAIRPDVLFHLAAQIDVQSSIANPAQDSNTNVVGTLRILQACKQSGVRKLVFSSTSAVYGEGSQYPKDESMATSPISFYGLSKDTAEKSIRLFHRLSGLPYTILRYSNVYGPRQTSRGEGGVISVFMNKLKQNLPLTVHGTGEQTRDFIYVQDIVEANLAAVRKGDGQTVNISTGRRTSINQLVDLLKRIHEPELGVEHSPARAGDIRDSCLDNRLAERVLEWSPRSSLIEGLKQTYRSILT
ncbi:NAD-dependent epimerase/dehydratase family protein [Cohnella thailandensis]|uniref:NAD-dependent epimerase/dehydratase family protein n=1 Tax=Cohnella thailandensis TaxID=557557 RepID=A0A841T6B7_9BACL|nr:NAD-dependent epimerase/dehydratase family protein [Cohnella thailandensis]MBB6638396.1 NAD-dependent epimerase/dehydratase family protein [Cohnella thailandensis]MBP1977126.1 UDP-glucose 4-epimerase [Cohnella thailandensis]